MISTGGKTTCLCSSSLPDDEGKMKTKSHCALHKTSLKIRLGTEVSDLCFYTPQHQTHTQGTWNSSQLTVTFALPNIQLAGEKKEVWYSGFIVQKEVYCFLKCLSSGFRCKVKSVSCLPGPLNLHLANSCEALTAIKSISSSFCLPLSILYKVIDHFSFKSGPHTPLFFI